MQKLLRFIVDTVLAILGAIVVLAIYCSYNPHVLPSYLNFYPEIYHIRSVELKKDCTATIDFQFIKFDTLSSQIESLTLAKQKNSTVQWLEYLLLSRIKALSIASVQHQDKDLGGWTLYPLEIDPNIATLDIAQHHSAGVRLKTVLTKPQGDRQEKLIDSKDKDIIICEIGTHLKCRLKETEFPAAIGVVHLSNSELQIPLTQNDNLDFKDFSFSGHLLLAQHDSGEKELDLSFAKTSGQYSTVIHTKNDKYELYFDTASKGSLKKGKKLIGKFEDDGQILSFKGDLYIDKWQKPLGHDLTISKFHLKKIDFDKILHKLTFQGQLDCRTDDWYGQNLPIDFSGDSQGFVVDVVGGTINGSAIKKLTFQYPQETLSFEGTPKLHTVLDYLDLERSFIDQSSGTLTYERVLMDDKEQARQLLDSNWSSIYDHFSKALSQHLTLYPQGCLNLYQWQNTPKRKNDANGHVSIERISALTTERNSYLIVNGLMEKQPFVCYLDAPMEDSIESQFHCQIDSFVDSLDRITIRGNRTNSHIFADATLRGSFKENSFNEKIQINANTKTGEISLTTGTSHQDSHNIFAHIDAAKKTLRLQSHHKSMTLDDSYLGYLIQLTQEKTKDKWNYHIDSKIDCLALNNQSFKDIHVSRKGQQLSFEGAYKTTKAKITLLEKPNQVKIDFTHLDLSDLGELAGGMPQAKTKPRLLLPVLAKSVQTTYQGNALGSMSLRAVNTKEGIHLENMTLESKDYSLKGSCSLSQEKIQGKGHVKLKSLPRFSKTSLSKYGLYSGRGMIDYQVDSDYSFSNPKMDLKFDLNECQINAAHSSSLKIIDILSGHFLKSGITQTTADSKISLDNLQIKARLDGKDRLTVDHCLMKMGPVVTLFTGNIIDDHIDGQLAVIPRVTQFVPPAAFLSGQFVLGSASLIFDQLFGDEVAKLAMEKYKIHGKASELINPGNNPKVIQLSMDKEEELVNS